MMTTKDKFFLIGGVALSATVSITVLWWVCKFIFWSMS